MAFTANMKQIVVRLSSGADDIVLVDGLDDLCAPLMGTAVRDCLLARVLCRDEMAVKNISSYLELRSALVPCFQRKYLVNFDPPSRPEPFVQPVPIVVGQISAPLSPMRSSHRLICAFGIRLINAISVG